MYRSDRILGGVKPPIVVIGYLEEIKPRIVVIGYLEEIKPCIVVIGYFGGDKASYRSDRRRDTWRR